MSSRSIDSTVTNLRPLEQNGQFLLSIMRKSPKECAKVIKAVESYFSEERLFSENLKHDLNALTDIVRYDLFNHAWISKGSRQWLHSNYSTDPIFIEKDHAVFRIQKLAESITLSDITLSDKGNQKAIQAFLEFKLLGENKNGDQVRLFNEFLREIQNNWTMTPGEEEAKKEQIARQVPIKALEEKIAAKKDDLGMATLEPVVFDNDAAFKALVKAAKENAAKWTPKSDAGIAQKAKLTTFLAALDTHPTDIGSRVLIEPETKDRSSNDLHEAWENLRQALYPLKKQADIEILRKEISDLENELDDLKNPGRPKKAQPVAHSPEPAPQNLPKATPAKNLAAAEASEKEMSDLQEKLDELNNAHRPKNAQQAVPQNLPKAKPAPSVKAIQKREEPPGEPKRTTQITNVAQQPAVPQNPPKPLDQPKPPAAKKTFFETVGSFFTNVGKSFVSLFQKLFSWFRPR